MKSSEKLTYRAAGVDTLEGQRAVSLMKEHVRKTFDANVLTDLGSFGGLYELKGADIKEGAEPVLVSGTDGVGTKLKLAFMTGDHSTVGQDCVAMCVNDVLCQGARPLFFLDYIATGKVQAEKISEIVKGIADGCREAGCALIGGETAEMPGFYAEGEYDMAGFCVGIVDKKKIITGEKISEGDSIIGLFSSGIHSNGYSLVRKVFFDENEFKLQDHITELGETLSKALLRPTRIYSKACRAVCDFDIKGIVHITGGGFFENVPRVLPKDLCAEFDTTAWEPVAIFPLIKKIGNMEKREMFSTFNMGIGMMFFAGSEDAEKMLKVLKENGEDAAIIGKVIKKQTDEVTLK